MLKNERHVRAGLAAASQAEPEDEGALATSSLSLGEDGRSMKLHRDHTPGGGSRLSKAALGSSAVQAALTLHPCIHVEGCGDASEAAMLAMFSEVGRCAVNLFKDEEGDSAGELSCTYETAAAAMLAIERFDGCRFDNDILRVSVAKTGAQGSLTRRGRGRNADKMTHYDRDKLAASAALEGRALAEKDAFLSARAAAAAASRPALQPERDAFTPAFKVSETTERAGAAAAPKKRSAVALPSFMVKQKRGTASAPTSEPPASAAPEAASSAFPAGTAAPQPANQAPGSSGDEDAAAQEREERGGEASRAGDLLGLGGYGDGSDSD